MPPDSVEKLMSRLQSENPVSLWLHENSSGVLVLDKIVVMGGARGGGVGTRVMGAIVEFADDHGTILALTPSDAFGGSKTRLGKFFRRFGFVPNAGRNKDFTISDTLVRSPKKLACPRSSTG